MFKKYQIIQTRIIILNINPLLRSVPYMAHSAKFLNLL